MKDHKLEGGRKLSLPDESKLESGQAYMITDPNDPNLAGDRP